MPRRGKPLLYRPVPKVVLVKDARKIPYQKNRDLFLFALSKYENILLSLSVADVCSS
jgi:hypothetical protein